MAVLFPCLTLMGAKMLTSRTANVVCGCMAVLLLEGLGCPPASQTLNYEDLQTEFVAGYTTSTQNGWTLEGWTSGTQCSGAYFAEMTLRLTSAERTLEAPSVASVRLEIRPADKPEETEVCAVTSPFALHLRKSLEGLVPLDAGHSKPIRLRPNPGWEVVVQGMDKKYNLFFKQESGKYFLKATVVLDDETKLVVDHIPIVYKKVKGVM